MKLITTAPHPDAALNWHQTDATTDSGKTIIGGVSFYAGSPDVPAHVYQVWVRREWWRKGVATAMMREVEEVCRAHGAKEISLYSAGGDRSHGLYLKVGYQFLGSLPEHRNLMVRELR